MVRHGPTHQKTMTGWRDVPADLSDTAALSRLNAFLPQGVVISSDLTRAITTADAIQGSRHRLPHHRALREMDFGAWDGLHHTEVTARDPQLSRDFWETPGDLTAPDGESWNALTSRVTKAIDAIIADMAPPHLIVVAHMGVIMCQFPRAGGTPYQAMGHSLDPLGVSRMDLGPDGWTLAQVNHRP
nr:histidine phosphatase family protein [Loktanella sp. SALINAS62]